MFQSRLFQGGAYQTYRQVFQVKEKDSDWHDVTLMSLLIDQKLKDSPE